MVISRKVNSTVTSSADPGNFDALCENDRAAVENRLDSLMGQLSPPSTPTDRHLQVIGFLRDYYTVNRMIPTVFEACSANDLSLEELRGLFPAGYRRGACRMAGLPFLG